jgi:hypothetical protein
MSTIQVNITAKRLYLTLIWLGYIIPLAFLDSSIRQSGRLLTARFQVRVLVEELFTLMRIFTEHFFARISLTLPPTHPHIA